MADSPLPDFSKGYAFADIPDNGIVAGKIGDDDVLLVRRGDDVFAIGAKCTHYHGPLAEGLVVGDTIRCPWHHACFSLKTGEALRAPALDAVDCWDVERKGDRVFVRDKRAALPKAKPRVSPASIVIVGGGAAGLAAADMLRRLGYGGPITMLSADVAPPSDRPNLSKDYLAGTAQESWIPLKGDDYFADQKIDLVLDARVESIDVDQRRVHLENGRGYPYGALLLATGAEPVHLTIPGAAAGDVLLLRTLTDSKTIIARAASAKRVLIIGASFIGLEVAASLRERKLDVHVVAPEAQPLERVLGAELGRMIRSVHEQHGVTFHLGAKVDRVDGRQALLSDGTAVADVDFIVAGVGVKPAVALAEQAGLTMDRGVSVNEFLETSAPGVFAAGDIARWPDPHSGERIRVEHFVVAERHGQAAAKNMLGLRVPFNLVPFFWSQHYDVVVNYVGHAQTWDDANVDGDLAGQDCTVTYRRDGKVLAVATVGRDQANLEAEARMEGNLK
ncbi:MAG TPA: FAD-dependent oxidoreductase [Vicinamibacterales bacterium]|nr:FAD-dependent oxidoreductase [Vicinamibacterales bacterium]